MVNKISKIFLVSLAVILCFVPAVSSAASISFDTAGGSELPAGGQTLSWNITNSGNIVWICVNDQSGTTTDTVTVNGNNATQVTGSPFTTVGGGITGYLFYYSRPPAGSITIAVNRTDTSASRMMASASTYKNAATSGIPDSANKGEADPSGPLTITNTSVKDNSWMLMCGFGNQNLSASTGFTQRDIQGATFQREILGDSNAAITPPGSNSMTIISQVNGFPAGLTVTFAPLTSSPSNMLMGMNY